MFDAITPRYDLLNRLMSARRDVTWRRRIAKFLPNETQRVIDVATGTGDLAIAICRERDTARVFGIDFVPRMLEFAAQKTKSSDIIQEDVSPHQSSPNLNRRISLTLGDAMHLPFVDRGFDAATIAFGLRNIPDKLEVLREMARVVRSGGKVLVLEITFPRNLGMRRFFNWYLNRVIPIMGGLISGDRKAYRYLTDSIQDFLHPDELCDLFLQAGLIDVRSHPLTLGIAYIHEGTVE